MDISALPSKPASPLSGARDGNDLRKPHEMIVLIPRGKRVTLMGRRVYTALLQVAQARLAAMPEMPPADFLFEAPLAAILRTSGSNGDDRTAAKRYLQEMRGLEVDWTSTAADNPGSSFMWRGFSMLSEVGIELRQGENWVSWSYPPTLMASLRNPTLWARIELRMLAKLGTYAALALYEICARYRGNPSGVTSRQAVGWWIDALSGSPAGSERREWRKFKNERVKEAIDEINRETDLEVELMEDKQGSRSVQQVQFAVREKRAAPRGRVQDQAPVDAGLVLRAESLGVRELKLEALISEFGDDNVRDKLQQLERRAANRQLPPVDNAYSYLRSLLRNDPGADAVDVPLALVPVQLPTSAPTAVPVRQAVPSAEIATSTPAGQGAANKAPPTAQEAWAGERIAAIKTEIGALAPAQRQAWVERAMEELAASGMLSPVIVRRAGQGDVLHGMLGSKVVRLYAQHTYGDQWDQAPASPIPPIPGV